MKILLVENHQEFTSMVIPTFLAQHEVRLVSSVASARAALASDAFDVVLVDYDLDDAKGDELVDWLASQPQPTPPIVAISAHQTGNDALVSAGATTVCPKPRFDAIGRVIDRVLATRGDAAP